MYRVDGVLKSKPAFRSVRLVKRDVRFVSTHEVSCRLHDLVVEPTDVVTYTAVHAWVILSRDVKNCFVLAIEPNTNEVSARPLRFNHLPKIPISHCLTLHL